MEQFQTDITLSDCQVEYEEDEEGYYIDKIIYLKSIYQYGKFVRYEELNITRTIDDDIKEAIIQQIKAAEQDDRCP
jgi:hypothetical protein